MAKKGIAFLLMVVMIGMLLTSCVTRPRYGDYVGYEKEEALDDLGRMKTGNTIKIVLNWLVWGGLGLWIPSIVDTINYVNYLDDFNSIERRIEVLPPGTKVTP